MCIPGNVGHFSVCLFLLTTLPVPAAILRVPDGVPGKVFPAALRFLRFAAEFYASWLSNLDLLAAIPEKLPLA